jgi:beta-glucosidase
MTQLPADFILGAATASYQIEGAAHEDGKAQSIWDTFCTKPGAIADGSNGDIACDHYHRMESDVALMSELGLDSYRFSICWPRVLRDDGSVNQAGMDFYSRLVDALLAAGI